MYQPAHSPQSIGGVLDDGFKLYRASLARVFVLALAGGIVSQVPGQMLQTTASGGAFLIAWLASVVISLTCYGAVIGRMNGLAGNQDLTLGEALSLGFKRAPALLLVSILYGVVVLVGSLLLLVPGILFSVSLMFSFYLVLLEGEGVISSLKTSHNLVWGNWWRTLVIVSVGTVMLMVAYVLVAFGAGFSMALSGADADSVAASWVLALVVIPVLAAVITPLLYAILLATYYDLKLRRSGADLEERLGVPAQA